MLRPATLFCLLTLPMNHPAATAPLPLSVPHSHAEDAMALFTGVLLISVGVAFFTSAGLLKLKGSLLNLTDEDYAYVKGYPMPGRTVWAGIRWEF